MSSTVHGCNLIALFLAAADRRRGAPAIVDADGRVLWSFQALADVGARLAGGLGGLGLGPGERVLVLERDPRRRFAAIAGILWAGATVMAPPPSLARWSALARVAAAFPAAVMFGPELWPFVVGLPALRAIPLRIVTAGPCPPGAVALNRLARAAPIAPRDVQGDTAAIASFTTGSSGPPRLVERSHDLLRAQHEALGRLRNLDERDRDLAGLPFLALHDLGAGVTCVLPPGKPGDARYGGRVRAAVTRGGVTTAAGFPALFEAASARADESLRTIRAVHVGGSRVTRGLLGALAAAAPRAEVTVVYGSTEAEPIASIPAGDYLAALADSDPDQGVCAGRVVDGLELRIGTVGSGDGATSGAVEGDGIGTDDTGEILVRGSRAVATHRDDGWTATGDVGRLDADGRLWLLGRTANAIGGRYPFQVERAIETLDWVGRAVLVRTDSTPGAAGLLVIEPRKRGAGERDTHERDAARVAAVRTLARSRGWPIDEVRLVREMPLLPGPAGKVDTQRLARAAASGGKQWPRTHLLAG